MALDSVDQIKSVWSSGSYSRFARTYLGMAAELVDATEAGAEDTVLDLACGTGNVAITAARRGATVTGLDITPAMLDVAETNAATAAVDDVTWREGTVTDLPFESDRFDVTLSSLGHMYGEPATAAGDELLRVIKPGGRFGFTAWTPTGLYPVLAGLVMTYLPRGERPEYSEPPFMWGDRDAVERRLDGRGTDLTFERATLLHPALSPEHFWQELVNHSGMFLRFLDAVHDREALREEAVETIAPSFDAAENAVELEYLRTTGTVATPD
jgi:SAM-dependent methyltransferase